MIPAALSEKSEMFESLASCFAFRCSAPLNMTDAGTLQRFNGLSLN